jgi:hypothetical protein
MGSLEPGPSRMPLIPEALFHMEPDAYPLVAHDGEPLTPVIDMPMDRYSTAKVLTLANRVLLSGRRKVPTTDIELSIVKSPLLMRHRNGADRIVMDDWCVRRREYQTLLDNGRTEIGVYQDARDMDHYYEHQRIMEDVNKVLLDFAEANIVHWIRTNIVIQVVHLDTIEVTSFGHSE